MPIQDMTVHGPVAHPPKAPTPTVIHLGLSPAAAEYVIQAISHKQGYEGPTYEDAPGSGTYDTMGTAISDEIDSQMARVKA